MISKKHLAAIALILIPIGALVALLQAAEDPPTELYVRTTPAGATLFLDGKNLGTAPDIFEVAPGKHELLAVMDGYKSAKRDIDVPATRIERVLLPLERIAPSASVGDGSMRKTKTREHIEEFLARPLQRFHVNKMPLDKMIEVFAGKFDVNIVLDRQSMSSERISQHTPITLELENTSTAEVLQQALTPLGLEYEIEEGTVVVRAVKTFFLPDVETPNVDAVLDLASGQTLLINGEKGFFAVREYTRQHHKGDLYYGYDEEDGGAFLGCMRGGAAMIWDGNRTRPFRRSQKREDVTVYLLPALPCRLRVTTAEEKAFDVTILRADRSTEGDEGIPRNASGIRLEYELGNPTIVPRIPADVVEEVKPANGSESPPDDKVASLPDTETSGVREASPSKGSQATFGPEVERVFTPEITRLGTFVDLESGKTFQVPEEVKEDSSGKKLIAWAKEKKVDISVRVRPGPICYLSSLDSYFWRSDDTSWHETTADGLLADRELKDGELGYGNITKRPDELPAVYMFKTRECGGGLLEIVEFDEAVEDVIGVKIRFKLLRMPDTPTAVEASSGQAGTEELPPPTAELLRQAVPDDPNSEKGPLRSRRGKDVELTERHDTAEPRSDGNSGQAAAKADERTPTLQQVIESFRRNESLITDMKGSFRLTSRNARLADVLIRSKVASFQQAGKRILQQNEREVDESKKLFLRQDLETLSQSDTGYVSAYSFQWAAKGDKRWFRRELGMIDGVPMSEEIVLDERKTYWNQIGQNQATIWDGWISDRWPLPDDCGIAVNAIPMSEFLARNKQRCTQPIPGEYKDRLVYLVEVQGLPETPHPKDWTKKQSKTRRQLKLRLWLDPDSKLMPVKIEQGTIIHLPVGTTHESFPHYVIEPLELLTTDNGAWLAKKTRLTQLAAWPWALIQDDRGQVLTETVLEARDLVINQGLSDKLFQTRLSPGSVVTDMSTGESLPHSGVLPPANGELESEATE